MSLHFLIVGLGNIGEEYHNTRHNIGFDVLDYFARQHRLDFVLNRLAFTTEIKIKNVHLTLIKPTTFMNLSGKAILFYKNKLNIPIQNILVITDDLSLPIESIKFKLKGSDGGHNGLKSIQHELQSQEYARFKFGIGNNFAKGAQAHFVLSQWLHTEKQIIEKKIMFLSECIIDFALMPKPLLMNKINAWKGDV